MKQLLQLILLACGLPAFAGDIGYATHTIPATLTANANAVKRMEDIRFEVINDGEAIFKHKYAITILNENGDAHAVLVEYYDKLRSVRSIEGTLYDAAGNPLKKLKSRDVLDESAVDNSSLMDDYRRKFHHFYHRVYPYTVEYEIEVRYNNTLFFPSWLPQEGEHYSVQGSRMTVVFPQDYSVRHKAFNYTGTPAEGTEKNRKTLTWMVESLPAISQEDAAPDWQELTTKVILGPTAFGIEDYKGNMSGWTEFGQFVHALKKDRDVLPPAIKARVGQLTAGITDPREKIQVLYRYLQKETRYISIQLGIGGWQPFDATFVAEKGYGDCKALTNYMYALLKEAGIPSYYTLVRAGRFKNILPDFPSQQFNHVILCVPLQQDTVWLECTSQTLPAGYLGDHTANRYALLVSEKGGKLVTTPRYSISDNLQHRTIKAKVNEDGTLAATINTDYYAMQQDELHGMINALSKEKVKKYLENELEFATYDINNFSYTEFNRGLPAIHEQLDVQVSNYATISGKRLFVTPNLMTRSYRKMGDEKRTQDICFYYEYKDVDTTEIQLPAGYAVESLPQEVKLSTPFGLYRCSVQFADNKLTYTRSLEQFCGRYPATEYGALAKFYAAIYKADRSRVVLVKKE